VTIVGLFHKFATRLRRVGIFNDGLQTPCYMSVRIFEIGQKQK